MPAMALESILRRDKAIVLSALAVIILLAWAYLLAGAGMGMSAFEMTEMAGMTGGGGAMSMMMAPAAWDAGYAILMFFMWWIMMVAMMLPSAAPMVLLFAAANRKQKEAGNPFIPTSLFASAYLVAWAGFSVIAVGLQWGFERTALLSPMMASANVIFGASLLIAAGFYQLTPLKQACLRYCQSPLQFVLARWRNGAGGAFRMGLEHGVFCVGCCWFLMGLLFFGGVMNLYWIMGIAVYVLLEKSVPVGHWLSYATGAVLIVGGGVLLAQLILAG